MFALQKSKTKVSARGQIDIRGVKDGVLLLPADEYRAVLHVSPINFELRSEDEQDAIIDTYESFLNSVGTPLQILIRSRAIDMDKYLADIRRQIQNEPEPIYQDQIEHYADFIGGLIQTNKILTRHFYVIVPLSNRSKLDFETIKEHLGLTLDIVSKGLSRLGMRARQLDSLEVLDLFYSFYSPEQAKSQPLSSQTLELIHKSFMTEASYV